MYVIYLIYSSLYDLELLLSLFKKQAQEGEVIEAC